MNVTTAGTYTIEARVAAAANGGTFHIEVNGVDETGPLIIPNTGGWQNWTTVSKAGAALDAGQQVWTLKIDGAGNTGVVGNLNYLRIASGSTSSNPAPFTGGPFPLPGTVQAENFDNGGQGVAYADATTGNEGGAYRTTDVDIADAIDTGDGYTLGWVGAGEWVQYTVTVGTAGTCDIEARVASAGAGGTFRIEVNGVDKTGPITVPDTGGWQSWTTIRKTGVSLGAGGQVWRVVMLTDGATGAVGNFNWFRVASAAPSAALLRAPYLQQVTADSAIVVWTTREPGTAEVRYGRAGGAFLSAAADTRVFQTAQTGLPHDFYQHEARLTGLAPSSAYAYGVFTGGHDLSLRSSSPRRQRRGGVQRATATGISDGGRLVGRRASRGRRGVWHGRRHRRRP